MSVLHGMGEHVSLTWTARQWDSMSVLHGTACQWDSISVLHGIACQSYMGQHVSGISSPLTDSNSFVPKLHTFMKTGTSCCNVIAVTLVACTTEVRKNSPSANT